MDEKTLAALKESIVKWRRNSQAMTYRDYRTGPGDCPLCVLYYGKDCEGCPVAEAASKNCENTPYGEAYDAYEDWKYSAGAYGGVGARSAAKLEVAFLESLLPEGETA